MTGWIKIYPSILIRSVQPTYILLPAGGLPSLLPRHLSLIAFANNSPLPFTHNLDENEPTFTKDISQR